jgi:site-specific DNA recombinase
LHEYAARNDFAIVREFIEIDSAKEPGRSLFDQMVQFLKRNRNVRIVLVEKTDRLYRNLEDAATIRRLDGVLHLVKEGHIISRDAKSQDKLIHGLNLVLSCNYSDKLSEEVQKGMRQKAELGIFPGRPPFGYRNNKGERTIEIHPDNSRIAVLVFERYATGAHSLLQLSKAIRRETGKLISKSNLHKMLTNRFYVGSYSLRGRTYRGTHEQFISVDLFERAQSVLRGHNKPKYSKHEFAFRGVMTCANCGCALTGDIKKEKYVYYACTGHRGKCGLARFREESIAERLGEPLQGLRVPDEIALQIVTTLVEDQKQATGKISAERSRLENTLTSIRSRIDRAYLDKLDGKISEELWERNLSGWQMEEDRLKMAVEAFRHGETSDRVLDAQRIFELANTAHSLYISQNSTEKVKLLKMLVSNCVVGNVSVSPTYRKPFDAIFKRAKSEEWSGREDSNLRPPGPETEADVLTY